MCVPLKLVVEVDGPLHEPGRDAMRDAYMSKLGITVLRFTSEAVRENLEGVVDRIRDEVSALQDIRGEG
jgi:very-short-patch-repair endonuclease